MLEVFEVFFGRFNIIYLVCVHTVIVSSELTDHHHSHVAVLVLIVSVVPVHMSAGSGDAHARFEAVWQEDGIQL